MAMRRPGQSEDSGDLLDFERLAAADGFRLIAGVDEAGRGPLAGPVVAAAVILPVWPCPLPVNDSKQLTEHQRDRLFEGLLQLPGIQIGVGIVGAAEIDEINILRATHKAMRVALEQLRPIADYALVDGLPVKGLPIPHRAIVKGDGRSQSIAAASIIAKVSRDRLMEQAEAEWPGYGFARHKGYGTAAHLEALRSLGPTPLHRRSFAPVREVLSGIRPPEQLDFRF